MQMLPGSKTRSMLALAPPPVTGLQVRRAGTSECMPDATGLRRIREE